MKEREMMTEELDYDGDLKIETDALDVEWLGQPRLFMRYAKILAQAEKEVDKAKQHLDIVRAKMDRRIRSSPSKFTDAEKLTEKLLDVLIPEQDEFKTAKEAVIEAEFNAKMAEGAVKAFAQRKDALENLVRLHAASYFAGPKVPRDLTNEWEKKEDRKKADDSVSDKMMRRRKVS